MRQAPVDLPAEYTEKIVVIRFADMTKLRKNHVILIASKLSTVFVFLYRAHLLRLIFLVLYIINV